MTEDHKAEACRKFLNVAVIPKKWTGVECIVPVCLAEVLEVVHVAAS